MVADRLRRREELGHAGVERRDRRRPATTRIHARPLAPHSLAWSTRRVDLLAGQRRAALEPDALDARRLEHVGLGVGEELGELDQLHAEADVGLVGAVALHGLLPRHAGDVADVVAEDVVDRGADRVGDEGEHLLLAGEGALHVELGELELAVGAEVLVAQAAGDLEVAVDAAHHAQLLVELRRLGQGVEACPGAGATARRSRGRPRAWRR